MTIPLTELRQLRTCLFLLTLLGASPRPLYSQSSPQTNQRQLGVQEPLRSAQAGRVDRAPKLDGTLDDPLWQQATPLTNFLQREPYAGQVPTERTEVRILYTKHEVYFGIACHDSFAGGPVATQAPPGCDFDPMRQQVDRWRAQQLSAEAAKLTIYQAFIEGDLDVPKHLARRVHELYFNPQHEEFEPRTTWSLSNAFTSAFKELDPIPQFKATAKLGGFLEARFSESF